MASLKGRDILILGGDWNGETGKSIMMQDSPIGRWGGGMQNENGKLMVQECELEQWFLPATFVNRPFRKKWTHTGNFMVKKGSKSRRNREIDHFMCSNNLKGHVEDVMDCRNTRHDSDHCLRLARIRFKNIGLKLTRKSKPVTSALR